VAEWDATKDFQVCWAALKLCRAQEIATWQLEDAQLAAKGVPRKEHLKKPSAPCKAELAVVEEDKDDIGDAGNGMGEYGDAAGASSNKDKEEANKDEEMEMD
jgi:hypothetical protein